MPSGLAERLHILLLPLVLAGCRSLCLCMLWLGLPSVLKLLSCLLCLPSAVVEHLDMMLLLFGDNRLSVSVIVCVVDLSAFSANAAVMSVILAFSSS